MSLKKATDAISHVNWLKITDISGTIPVLIIRAMMWLCVQIVPYIHPPRAHVQLWVWASDRMVGGISCLLWLVSGWVDLYCLSMLITRWIPGLAESKISIPVKVPGVEPDLNSLLHHTVHISHHSTEDGYRDVLLNINYF